MTAAPDTFASPPPASAAPERRVFVSGVVLLVRLDAGADLSAGRERAVRAATRSQLSRSALLPSFDLASLTFFVHSTACLDALWNSVRVAVVTMILSIGCGAPAGYALSRFDFPGKELFRFLVVMTRAFPLPLLALPLAVMFIRTGLDDTILGLALVHTTLALPFAVLITFSLFSGIPVELEEAAWTLGCTRFRPSTQGDPAAGRPRHRGQRGLCLRHLVERGLRRRRADASRTAR